MNELTGSLSPVTAAEAVALVKREHYSGTCVPGVLRYGWRVEGELVGVSVFDTGNHAMRCGVFGPEHYRHVLHHHRLALAPGQPKGTASQFIGACLRQIRFDRPETWAIVTYADTCQGHPGTIYQATNALFTGKKAVGNLKFLTAEGELMTTQSLKGDWPQRRAEAAKRGWTEIRCKGKNRYIHLIGTGNRKRKLRERMQWPILPYPDTGSS